MVGIVSSMGTVMGNIKEPSTIPAGDAATRVAKGTCDPHGFLTGSREICVIHQSRSLEPAGHGHGR